MTAYPISKLADLVTISGDNLDPRKHPSEMFELFSIPAFDAGTISEEVRGEEIGSVKRTVLPGDCLFAKLNPRINRVLIVPPTKGRRQIASPEFWPLRRREGVALLPSYLRYVLSWQSFRESVIGREEAATKSRSRLKPTQLLSKCIPFPSLSKQERIVRLLDAADDLRRLREQADRRTADLVPALFHEMFGDPASNLKGWEITPCHRLLIEPLRNGISPATGGAFAGKVLTLSAITAEFFDSTAWKEAFFASALDESQCVNRSLFLICRGNGNLKLVGAGKFPSQTIPGLSFPDTMIAARLREDVIEPHFLEVAWSTPFVRRQIEASARTTNGTYKINQGAVERIELPIPSLELQTKFAHRVSEVRAIEAKQAESRRRLDDLFQSLLHRAFRGEL